MDATESSPAAFFDFDFDFTGVPFTGGSIGGCPLVVGADEDEAEDLSPPCVVFPFSCFGGSARDPIDD